MKWYKRDPNAARLEWLRRRYGRDCCGEFPAHEHIPHFLYLAGAASGPVKVGICQDLRARLRALQTAAPFPMDLFWSALVPSKEIARDAEQLLLRSFPRINGEWLDVTPPRLINFLEG